MCPSFCSASDSPHSQTDRKKRWRKMRRMVGGGEEGAVCLLDVFVFVFVIVFGVVQ